MKISLIVPTESASVGARVLSSYLRSKGHETRLIFVPNMIPIKGRVQYARNARFEASDKLNGLIGDLVSDSDLVGFSTLAQFHEPLTEVSAHIRNKLGKPVIWGGIHATMSPQSCLEHADLVCIGDGEDTLLDIVNALESGGSWDHIPGIVFLRDGKTISTEFRPAITDLDSYPPLDFSFEDHFYVLALAGQEKVFELTPETYPDLQGKYSDPHGQTRNLVPYKTVSGRGCPYTCSYCSIGSQDKKLHPFRSRSVEHVIRELEQVIAAHGDMIDVISFSDDTFLTHNMDWINEFCEKYVDRVGRQYPFRVLGHPFNVRRDKIVMLCEAGCLSFGMGIESLSEHTLYEIFNRRTPPQKVVDAANLLIEVSQEYKIHPPGFDIILSNPYESPEESLESFRWLTRIKMPASIGQYHLTFFPGSVLSDRAIQDGLISEDDPIQYRSWYKNPIEMRTYLKMLYDMVNTRWIPRRLLRFLASPPVYRLGDFVLKESQLPYKLVWLAQMLHWYLKRVRGFIKLRIQRLTQQSSAQGS